MESLFSISEPPLGVRIMNNPTWPLLTDEARMEKLRTLLFHDLHGTEGAAESHQSNSSSSNINANSGNNEVTVHDNHQLGLMPQEQSEPVPQVSESEQRVNNTCATPSRYESQKRRDWNTFRLYLKNHRLELQHCSGAHVLEFLRYLDQFGKTKVHLNSCSFYGVPIPPHPCRCPLRQAWGSLDALIGRLRAAFEEHGGKPESNPFGARMVRLYLREVREMQAKARGVAYGKKKRKCSPPRPVAAAASAASASAAAVHGTNSANLGASSNSGENHSHQQQQLLQQQTSPESLPPQMQQQQQQALVPHDQAYDHHQGPDPGSFELPVDYSGPPPDPHPLNAYSPNSNPLIKPAAMSNFRPPLSFHSFLDDLPGRRAEAAGWAIGTVYGR